MEPKISKDKISSYQKLKARILELETGLEAIMERPQGSEAKGFRLEYKIKNNLL